MLPLSVRNNNPGNIMSPTYGGAIGATPAGYGIYETPDAGWQAMSQLYGSYLRRGFNTPNKIARRWTGGDEGGAGVGNEPGSTANYAQAIADAYGIGLDDPVPGDNFGPGLTAMATFETGSPWEYGTAYSGDMPVNAAAAGQDTSMAYAEPAVAAPDSEGIQAAVSGAVVNTMAPLGAGTESDSPIDDGQFLGPLGRMGLAILSAPGRGGNLMMALAGGLQQGMVNEQQLQNSLLRREKEMAETRSRLSAQSRGENYRASQAKLVGSDAFAKLSDDDKLRAMMDLSSMFSDDPMEAMQRRINAENAITQRNRPAENAALKQQEMALRFAQQQALLDQRQAGNMQYLQAQQQGRAQPGQPGMPGPAGPAVPPGAPPSALPGVEQPAMPLPSEQALLAQWQEKGGTAETRAQRNLALVNEYMRQNNLTPDTLSPFIRERYDNAVQQSGSETNRKRLQQRQARQRGALNTALSAMTAGDILEDEIAPNRVFQSGFMGNLLALGEPALKDVFQRYPDAPKRFRQTMGKIRESIIENMGSMKGTLSDKDMQRLDELLSSSGTFTVDSARESIRLVNKILDENYPGMTDQVKAAHQQFRNFQATNPAYRGSTLELAPGDETRFQVRTANGGLVGTVDAQGNPVPYYIGGQ